MDGMVGGMNTHGDHPAICLCCKHLFFSEGEPGYSSYTPSTPMSMSCCKNHTEVNFDGTERGFHDSMTFAGRCPDFEPKP